MPVSNPDPDAPAAFDPDYTGAPDVLDPEYASDFTHGYVSLNHYWWWWDHTSVEPLNDYRVTLDFDDDLIDLWVTGTNWEGLEEVETTNGQGTVYKVRPGQELTPHSRRLDFWIEGIGTSDDFNVKDFIKVEATSARRSVTWEDTGNYGVADFDLGIDSNNDEIIDYFDDFIEDKAGTPGKVINVSNVDSDGDGLLDFVDGFNWGGSTEDDVSSESRFVELTLDLVGFNQAESEDLFVRFSYNASDPVVYRDAFEANDYESQFARPENGKMRIWTADGNVSRDLRPLEEGGNFVGSETYRVNDLNIVDGSVTLYVETVNPSTEVGDLPINVTLLRGGEEIRTDTVRITSTLTEIYLRGDVEGVDDLLVEQFVASAVPHLSASGEELLNQFVAEHDIRVYDPRSNIESIELHNTTIPLQRFGSYYTNQKPIVIFNESDRGLMNDDVSVILDDDLAREHRYTGAFLPDDESFGSTPWTVDNNGAIANADYANGVLNVDTAGSVNDRYVASTTTQGIWTSQTDFDAEVRIKLNGSSSGQYGAFNIAFGNGNRYWSFGLDGSHLYELQGGDYQQVAIVNLLDGNFHNLRFTNSWGQETLDVSIDGSLVAVASGISDSTVGVFWGDFGSETAGNFDLAYLGWAHPDLDLPPISQQRPSEIASDDVIRAYVDEGTTPVLAYGPTEQKIRQTQPPTLFSGHASGPDATIAKWVEESVDELGPNWTSPNQADSGSYGKAMSDKVREKIGAQSAYYRKQWKTGVLVNKHTLRIEKFGATRGSEDLVEVDIMHFEKGYNPKEGDILDQSKITVYELKASRAGTISQDQLTRLRAIQGGEIRRLNTKYAWRQGTNELVDNKAYLRRLDITKRLGKLLNVAAPVAVIVTLPGSVDKFDELEQAIKLYASKTDFVEKQLEAAGAAIKLRELLVSLGASDMLANTTAYGLFLHLEDRVKNADHWQD